MSSIFVATWRAQPRPRTLRLDGSILAEGVCAGGQPIRFGSSSRLCYSSVPASSDVEPVTVLVKNAPKQPRRKSRRPVPDGIALERDLERSKFASSVLVPRARTIPSTSKQQHRVDSSRHKAITRQVLHEKRRAEDGSASVDWRLVLEQMVNATPEESLEFIEDGIRIEFAEKYFQELLKDVEDTAFSAVRKRSGAVIKVSEKASAVVLSGTRQAINRATEEFKNIARNITVTRLYRPLKPGEEAVENPDMSWDLTILPLSIDEGKPRRKPRLKQHVYDLSMPKEWTPESLRDYVLLLVDSYTDPPLHSKLYSTEKNDGNAIVHHQLAVVIRLLRLFRRLGHQISVSRSVVKLALISMTQKGDIFLDQARHLFIMMERRGIPFDVDVFNVLLRAPVKLRDLRKFRQTLFMMTARGFSPDFETWILFLRMFESVEVRHYILQAMHAKNMLETPRIIQRIGDEMASYDAEHAAVHGTSLDEFLELQDNRYGPRWLTRIAGNKVLHVLGQYNRLEDACKLVDIMWKRYFQIPKSDSFEQIQARPRVDTYNTIMNHVRIYGDLITGLTVLRKMQTKHHPWQPSGLTLDLLFKTAWRANLRTTIVAIWRYAALARITSHGMRRRVAAVLRGETETGDQRHDDRMLHKRYVELGGEGLARELAGGREALAQLRTLCHRKWADQVPWTKLGSLTARMLPLAFEGRVPAVRLSRVLMQSVKVDFRCLRAQKINRLRDLLLSGKVKSVPLWPRTENTERYTDVGPRENIHPSKITVKDKFEDEWDSEGWDVSGPFEITSLTPHSDAGKTASTAEPKTAPNAKSTARTEAMRMAIINPWVWDGDALKDSALEDMYRTPLQKDNEQACLAGLEQLSNELFSFRYMFSAERRGDVAEDEEMMREELEEDKSRSHSERKMSRSVDKNRSIGESEFREMMSDEAVILGGDVGDDASRKTEEDLPSSDIPDHTAQMAKNDMLEPR